jgi:hypothetical protein
MDMEMIQKVITWVQDNVGGTVSKTELVQKADDSDLPDSAKSAFRELPEGQHTKEGVIEMLKDRLMAGVGGGGIGGMFGKGM